MPKFQLTLLFVNLSVFFLTIFSLAFQLNHTIADIHQIGMKINLGSDHPLFFFLNKLEHEFLISLGIGAIFSFIAMTTVTLILTHKIAGPIIRLESYLKTYLATKKFETLNFRKNDFFKEIPPLINQVINKDLENKKQNINKDAA